MDHRPKEMKGTRQEHPKHWNEEPQGKHPFGSPTIDTRALSWRESQAKEELKRQKEQRSGERPPQKKENRTSGKSSQQDDQKRQTGVQAKMTGHEQHEGKEEGEGDCAPPSSKV